MSVFKRLQIVFPIRVNCTIPTLSKSKGVRGKYCFILPGERTFEKRQRTNSQSTTQPFQCRHATPLPTKNGCVAGQPVHVCGKKTTIFLVLRFAEILHAKQSHQSGWTRVIGKILALNQRHFDTEHGRTWPEFKFSHARQQWTLKKIPTESNENFTKKCGISKIICDTASPAIYLNTRLRLRLKG